MDNLGAPDSLAHLASAVRANPTRATHARRLARPANPDSLARKDRLDQTGSLETQAHLRSPAEKDLPDLKDLLDLMDSPETLESLEDPEHPDRFPAVAPLWARPVPLARQASPDNQESLEDPDSPEIREAKARPETTERQAHPETPEEMASPETREAPVDTDSAITAHRPVPRPDTEQRRRRWSSIDDGRILPRKCVNYSFSENADPYPSISISQKLSPQQNSLPILCLFLLHILSGI
jgi:hypothetical protein